jgi:hypothetical protein
MAIPVVESNKLRFWGRHRCPRCRMPLRAEEIACPVCELQLVFIAPDGQVMVEMIAAEAPGEWTPELMEDYLEMLRIESSGDMYLPDRHFPTRPQFADLAPGENGEFRIRLSNRVSLNEVKVVRE